MKKYISLGVNCPHCLESLMDMNYLIHGYPSIKVDIETARAKGRIWLCSIYDCYDHENDIELREVEEVKFYCPHCHQSLMLDKDCSLCKAKKILPTKSKTFIMNTERANKSFASVINF